MIPGILLRTVALVGCAILIGGCATIRSHEAMDTERALSAAGFRMQFADTPEKQASVQSLPQRKLVATNKDGMPVWVYADLDYCKCVYLGSQAAYGRYQKVREQQLVADEMEDASLDWGPWGGWF